MTSASKFSFLDCDELTHTVVVQRAMSQHLCRVQQDLTSLHGVVETLLTTVRHDHPECVTLVRPSLCKQQSCDMAGQVERACIVMP